VFSFAFILIYKYKFLRVIKEQLLIMVILWCEKTMRWWNKWKQDYFLKTSCGVGASEASQILDHDGTSNTWYLVNAGLILNIQSGICSNSLHAQFAKLTWDLVRGYPYTRVCQSPESCVPGMALSFVTVARKRKRQWRGSVTHEIHHQEIVGQVNSIQGQESSWGNQLVVCTRANAFVAISIIPVTDVGRHCA